MIRSILMLGLCFAHVATSWLLPPPPTKLTSSSSLTPKSTQQQTTSNLALILSAAAVVTPLTAVQQVLAAATEADSVASIAVPYDDTTNPLSTYLGKKATLIVNVASECALTPQYEDLVQLYNQYKDQGFTVLGFPCNQFGSQEPEEDAKKIRSAMKARFGAEFPIFNRIEVNGFGEHPLYTKLKATEGIATSSVKKISWNFEKVPARPLALLLFFPSPRVVLTFLPFIM